MAVISPCISHVTNLIDDSYKHIKKKQFTNIKLCGLILETGAFFRIPNADFKHQQYSTKAGISYYHQG